MTQTAWNDDRVRRLVALWREGASAGEIARALGPGVSRSAVLGKLHRLNLTRGSGAPAAAPRGFARSALRAPPPRTPPASPSAPDPPGFGTRTLLSVARRECRWPLGDPGEANFALCGRAIARGSYCAVHGRLAYRGAPADAAALLRLAGLA